MTCHSPIKAYWSAGVNQNGRRYLVFKRNQSNGQMAEIACGQCAGCRLVRSREWAVRIMHELKYHDDSCFLTLTYEDEHLPRDLGLVKEHFQKFMKRLRKQLDHRHIKYFYCGEYGEQKGRPHFHAIVLGWRPTDANIHLGYDTKLFTSPSLERLWGKGYVSVAEVTFDSSAYVARYVMKKITGDLAEDHYIRVDDFGQVYRVEPEFAHQSKGIGKRWIEDHYKDVYRHDVLYYMKGGKVEKMRPPKYYDKWLQVHHTERWEELVQERANYANENELTHDAREALAESWWLRQQRHNRKLL
jgi:hypothetical protein